MAFEKPVLVVDPGELELRAFVAGLAGEKKFPGEVPRALQRIAERVLRRVPVQGLLEPEDLVALFVVRLLEQKRRRGEGALRELLNDGVRSLGGVIRHRLHQLATEHVPGRKVRRELRAHIRSALEARARGSAERPDSLLVGGRYGAGRVAQAVRWLISEGVEPELRQLERVLVSEFSLGTEHVALDLSQAAPSTDPEALMTARALRTALGETRAELLGRKLAGSTIQELASEQGRGLATIHDHLKRAEEATGAFFAQEEVSPKVARESLKLLRRG